MLLLSPPQPDQTFPNFLEAQNPRIHFLKHTYFIDRRILRLKSCETPGQAACRFAFVDAAAPAQTKAKVLKGLDILLIALIRGVNWGGKNTENSPIKLESFLVLFGSPFTNTNLSQCFPFRLNRYNLHVLQLGRANEHIILENISTCEPCSFSLTHKKQSKPFFFVRNGLPDEPFYHFGALQSVVRCSWTE